MPPKTATKTTATKKTTAAKPAGKGKGKGKGKPAAAPKKAPAAKAESSAPRERKTRVPLTPDSLQGYLDELVGTLDSEIAELSKSKTRGSRTLRAIRRQVLLFGKRALTLANKGKKKNRTSSSNGGFKLPYSVSPELASFLKIGKDEKINREDVTRAICVYTRLRPGEARPAMLRWEHLNKGGKRDLQDPDNKKAVIPDKALTTLLGYDQYKKDVAAGKVTKIVTVDGEKREEVVTDDALYYYVIQRLVQQHFRK